MMLSLFHEFEPNPQRIGLIGGHLTRGTQLGFSIFWEIKRHVDSFRYILHNFILWNCFVLSFCLELCLKLILVMNPWNGYIIVSKYVTLCHFCINWNISEHGSQVEFLKGLNERKWVVIACFRVGWIICLTVNIFKKRSFTSGAKIFEIFKKVKNKVHFLTEMNTFRRSQ